ncbi:MAG: hypothetical protein Aurels2KO_48370 [Aureliella sp.]
MTAVDVNGGIATDASELSVAFVFVSDEAVTTLLPDGFEDATCFTGAVSSSVTGALKAAVVLENTNGFWV